jgi:hypothetical protein
MLTKLDHRRICDELSETMRLDRERRRLEIERISSPRTAEKVTISLLVTTCIVTAIILIIKHYGHA